MLTTIVRITAIVLTMTFMGLFASAQVNSNGLARLPLSSVQKALNNRKNTDHSAIQPFAYGLESNLTDSTLTIIDTTAYNLLVRPIGFIHGGVELGSNAIGTLAAGALAELRIKDKWSADLGYALVVQQAPNYYRYLADSARIIPGAGLAVRDAKNVYHTHLPFGRVGYKAGKYFHFELGRHKHFWGNGYRSLILSDNASPYPYFRLTTKVWKIKYTNLWARMDDISAGQSFADRRGKYTALHALSWNVSKRVNLQFFEMVVWQDRDTMSRRHLDLNYFNPLIFYRPVEFAQGSADNVLIGAGWNIKASDQIQVYGQVVIDEFLLAEIQGRRGWWANKFGGQVGLRYFDLFTPGFSWQTEVNAVRPFTYTHGSPVQAWGHLNQPLAHPLGANFYEWINVFRYDRGLWSFREKFSWAVFGRDADIDNLGGNIFRSYKAPGEQFGNYTTQGLKSIYHFHELMISRKLTSIPGMEAFITHTVRFERTWRYTLNDHFFLCGIRVTGLLENYTDF